MPMTDMMRYIVVAGIAFALGITLTVFCMTLKNWRDEKNKEDKQ